MILEMILWILEDKEKERERQVVALIGQYYNIIIIRPDDMTRHFILHPFRRSSLNPQFPGRDTHPIGNMCSSISRCRHPLQTKTSQSVADDDNSVVVLVLVE